METITSGKHTFEIVDHIPGGYQIWNIGKNMVDGYLPLCRLKAIQPFEGCTEIEPDTLKAIRTDGAQTILAAIGGGQNTIPEMERYIKRYSRSKNHCTMRRVERMKAALVYMYQLKWR